ACSADLFFFSAILRMSAKPFSESCPTFCNIPTIMVLVFGFTKNVLQLFSSGLLCGQALDQLIDRTTSANHPVSCRVLCPFAVCFLADDEQSFRFHHSLLLPLVRLTLSLPKQPHPHCTCAAAWSPLCLRVRPPRSGVVPHMNV